MSKRDLTANTTKYRKSEFLESVRSPSGFWFVFHAFFGRGMYLDKRAAEVLEDFSEPRRLEELETVPSDLLDEYRRRGFIVNADSPEREKVVNQYLKYYP
ncbi:MAG: hypothetical protein JRG97_11470, partial [Deltaproteobacteria bacterium]|nr:hypothetical protein [Deltaproteobacteria bacterium]